MHKHYQASDISKQTDMYLRPSIRGKDCSVFSPCKRLTVCPSPCWGSASTHRSQTPSWEPAQRPATHPDTGLLQDTRHDRMHWIIHVLTHRSVRISPLHTEVRRRPTMGIQIPSWCLRFTGKGWSYLGGDRWCLCRSASPRRLSRLSPERPVQRLEGEEPLQPN